MNRWGLALAALVVLGGVAVVIGTGAFPVGPVDQLQTEQGDNSGVFFQPADTPNGERYANLVDDEPFVSLTVAPDSKTQFDDVFYIGFEGVGNSTDPAAVWVEYESDLVTMVRMDTGEPIGSEDNAVVLEPEQTVLVGFSVDSEAQPPGNVTETVTYRTNVPAEQPDEPFFDVAIDDVTSPVVAGEGVRVDATIENTGDETDTQVIDLLDTDANPVDSTELTLEGGETEVLSFTWTTDEGATGADNVVTVTSEDDRESASVAVRAPDEATPPEPPEPEPTPFFEVAIENVTPSVAHGEAVTVDTVVENVGDETGTQRIDLLDFDDAPADGVDALTLAPGESRSLAFTWTPDEDDIGTDTVTATSLDDQDTAVVTVETPDPADPEFLVNITETNSLVEAEETLEVEAVVENVGGVADTQVVELLDFDNVTVEATELTLPPGEETTVEFTWVPEEDDIGAGTVTATSLNDKDTAVVTIEEPAPTVVGFGIFGLTGVGWLLFTVTLAVLADYLVQTRLRGALPLLETPREVRNARTRYALSRLGLLWVAVLAVAFASMWALFAAGVAGLALFALVLLGSVLLGTVAGRYLVPDIEGKYLDDIGDRPGPAGGSVDDNADAGADTGTDNGSDTVRGNGFGTASGGEDPKTGDGNKEFDAGDEP